MLDTLRANSRSVLTYVLFGIIIVVFVVSFGPGSRGCSGSGSRSESWAAKVNGSTVSPTEFEQQYGQLARLYQQQGGDTTGLLQARLRQMAMDQVVQRELIDQEAQRQGIVVSDDEVSNAIKALPAFQSNGQFDMELYKRAVTGAYGSPGKFEERMRRDLAYQKMIDLLRGTAKVTDDEVKDAWMAENDRAAVEFARFPLAAARAEVKPPTDAQVSEFAAREGARIEKFYQDNPARFDRKKRVRARHILVRTDEKAPAAAQEAARKKIEELTARIRKGEDFGKVAQEASEDPGSKTRGGDLGFFGPGVMAKEFEDAAFALKPGELSAPVKTTFGWHVIRVDEVQPAELIPLDKARPEIARELLQEDLAKKVATARATETLQRLKGGKSFAEALPAEAGKGKKAEPVKLGGQVIRPEESGSFTASAAPSIPRIGPAPDLFADVLKANAGQVLNGVYETASGPVVVRVKERVRPDVAKLAERRGEVESRLKVRRESEIERAWVEDLKKRSKVQTNQEFVMGTARATPVELD